MKFVIVTSMLIAVTCYVLFGVFAYLRSLEATTGDTLADFDDTLTGQILRVSVVFALVLTFPLFVFEGAHNIDVLLFEDQDHDQDQDRDQGHDKAGGLRRTSSLGVNRLSLASSISSISTRSFYNESEKEPLMTNPNKGLNNTRTPGTNKTKSGASPPNSTGGQSDYKTLSSTLSSPNPGFEVLEYDVELPNPPEEEDLDSEQCIDRVRLLGLVFTFLAGIITILIQNTSLVIGVVGAVCGIPISYVLPPWIYICSELYPKNINSNSSIGVAETRDAGIVVHHHSQNAPIPTLTIQEPVEPMHVQGPPILKLIPSAIILVVGLTTSLACAVNTITTESQ